MMHIMYSEGLLNPEFSTMSDEQAYQYVAGRRVALRLLVSATAIAARDLHRTTDVPYEYEAMSRLPPISAGDHPATPS